LRGAARISIGRFSLKFFGKRRKRGFKLDFLVCTGLSRKVFVEIGFCGDTDVFVGSILAIESQIGGIEFGNVCGHFPKCLSQFVDSRVFAGEFNLGAQVDVARSFSIRAITDLSQFLLSLISLNLDLGGAALFYLFDFPLVPPSTQFRH
jgi:hypothetical protein